MTPMRNPAWAEILEILYAGPLFVNEKMGAGDGTEYELIGYLNSHPKLDEYSEEELQHHLDNLESANLVRAVGTAGGGLSDEQDVERYGGLTPEGFRVVHDREIGESQSKSSKQVAYFTGILAFSSIIQGLNTLTQTNDILTTVMLALVIIALLYLVWLGFKEFRNAEFL